MKVQLNLSGDFIEAKTISISNDSTEFVLHLNPDGSIFIGKWDYKEAEKSILITPIDGNKIKIS